MTITTQLRALAAYLLTAASLFSSAASASDWEFRGIPLNQGTEFASPAFGRGLPYWTDISDSFLRNGRLGASDADGDQVGFIPPVTDEPVPDGPLTGTNADEHGRWMPVFGDYATSTDHGGSVRRANGAGIAVACLPWHVISGLGDRYMIEMDAVVAVGESVTLGYFGDITQTGSPQGLNGELGQLILEVERDQASPEDVTWTIEWDLNGNRQQVVSTLAAPVDDELRLQLAWDDLLHTGNDLFDAWIATADGTNQHLAQGTMGTAIDVFGVGFEIEGMQSYITGFTAAVPEPSAGFLLGFGILGLVTRFNRKDG